jgi:hypothetical protein
MAEYFFGVVACLISGRQETYISDSESELMQDLNHVNNLRFGNRGRIRVKTISRDTFLLLEKQKMENE